MGFSEISRRNSEIKGPCPAYDFAWTWGSISDVGFRGDLTGEEVQILQDTFKTEYEHSMGENLAPLPAQQLAILTKQLHFIANANWDQKDLVEKQQLPNKQKEFDCLQRLIDSTVRAVVVSYSSNT